MAGTAKATKAHNSSGSSWVEPQFSNEAFEDCKRFLKQEIPFREDEELTGGLSGARVQCIQVDPANSHGLRGRYILKVGKTQFAEQEKNNHERVKNDPVLGEYIPHLYLSLDYEAEGLTGLFYGIAGDSLLTMTTLQNSLERDRYNPPGTLEKVASTLLEWSIPRKATHEITRVGNVLDTIRQGLEPHRLADMEDRLSEVVDDLDRTCITDPLFDKHWELNPVPYLLGKAELPGLAKHGVLHGPRHGDLHAANVIIPKLAQIGHYTGDVCPFMFIDFAMADLGDGRNALFDLAYFELAILMNLFGNFAAPSSRWDWWRLEVYLGSGLRPRLRDFPGTIGGNTGLAIRRSMKQRAEHDGLGEVYWISYLAASVEAGLNFARKLQPEPMRQRIAFLTAAVRFTRMVELLQGKWVPDGTAPAKIQWPPSTPSPAPPGIKAQPSSGNSEARIPLSSAWPGPVMTPEALFDPEGLAEYIKGILAAAHDQGVLLIAERRSNKTSFYNALLEMLSQVGHVEVLCVEVIGFDHTIHTFADQLLEEICDQVGVAKAEAGLPLDAGGCIQYTNISSFTRICQRLLRGSTKRYVLFVDEVDSAVENAPIDDAKQILQLVYQLQKNPRLPIRVLLTASAPDLLRSKQFDLHGSELLFALRHVRIPHLSRAWTQKLIERLDFRSEIPSGQGLSFTKRAVDRVFEYSGGQIYLIKMLALAITADERVQKGLREVDAALVDDALRQVIKSESDQHSNLHDTVYGDLTLVFDLHFSADEKDFARQLVLAGGKIKVSQVKAGGDYLLAAAESLRKRDYVFHSQDTKESGDENEDEPENECYEWRIGLWQLFLTDWFAVYSEEEDLLQVNEATGLIHVGRTQFKPTPKEREILYCLAPRAEEVVTYDELASGAWGAVEGVSNESMASAIHRLRNKLEKIKPGTEFVETATGQGFILHHTRYTPKDKSEP